MKQLQKVINSNISTLESAQVKGNATIVAVLSNNKEEVLALVNNNNESVSIENNKKNKNDEITVDEDTGTGIILQSQIPLMTNPFHNDNYAYNDASMNESNSNNIKLSVDTETIECDQRKRKKI